MEVCDIDRYKMLKREFDHVFPDPHVVAIYGPYSNKFFGEGKFFIIKISFGMKGGSVLCKKVCFTDGISDSSFRLIVKDAIEGVGKVI